MSLTDLDALAGDDDDLNEFVRAQKKILIQAVVEEAVESIKYGDLTTKASTMKMILPLVLASSEKNDKDNSDAATTLAEAREMLSELGRAIEEYGTEDG